jgi:hypothetical protein
MSYVQVGTTAWFAHLSATKISTLNESNHEKDLYQSPPPNPTVSFKFGMLLGRDDPADGNESLHNYSTCCTRIDAQILAHQPSACASHCQWAVSQVYEDDKGNGSNSIECMSLRSALDWHSPGLIDLSLSELATICYSDSDDLRWMRDSNGLHTLGICPFVRAGR